MSRLAYLSAIAVFLMWIELYLHKSVCRGAISAQSLKHTRVQNANISQLKQGYKMYAFHVRTEPMICLELANVLVLQEKLENSNCFSGRHADSPWILRHWGADLVGELTNLEILGPYWKRGHTLKNTGTILFCGVKGLSWQIDEMRK